MKLLKVYVLQHIKGFAYIEIHPGADDKILGFFDNFESSIAFAIEENKKLRNI